MRGRNPGSARYDAAMTDDERADESNGIWLCNRCHKQVDDDKNGVRFTVAELGRWKDNHGTWLLGEYDGRYVLPNVDISAVEGISVATTAPQKITAASLPTGRRARITVTNRCEFELRHLDFFVQWPWIIEGEVAPSAPLGTPVSAELDTAHVHVDVTGDGAVALGALQSSFTFKGEIADLPPGRSAAFDFTYVPSISPRVQDISRNNAGKEIVYFMGGDGVVPTPLRTIDFKVCVPFLINLASTSVRAGPAEVGRHGDGRWMRRVVLPPTSFTPSGLDVSDLAAHFRSRDR